MKLRHQVFLLIALPVLCQIGSVGLLAYTTSNVDRASQREIKAKEVLAACIEIEGLTSMHILQLINSPFTPDYLRDWNIISMIKRHLEELRGATADDAGASAAVEQLIKSETRLLELFADISKSWKPGQDGIFFAQFINNDDLVESLASAFMETKRATTKLSTIYRPIAQALGPRQFRLGPTCATP